MQISYHSETWTFYSEWLYTQYLPLICYWFTDTHQNFLCPTRKCRLSNGNWSPLPTLPEASVQTQASLAPSCSRGRLGDWYFAQYPQDVATIFQMHFWQTQVGYLEAGMVKFGEKRAINGNLRNLYQRLKYSKSKWFCLQNELLFEVSKCLLNSAAE